MIDTDLGRTGRTAAGRRVFQELVALVNSEYGPGVLLIIITAYAQDNARRQAYEADFDHHLTKPVDFATIADLMA